VGVSRRGVLVAGGVGAAAVAGSAVFLFGGEGNEGVRSVIQENARTFEEAVDRHMETMHPESPIYNQTRSQIEAVLQQVPAEELSVEVTVESVETSGESANAEVVQTTRVDVSGFRDNRTRLTHELRTYQDEWRLYNSTIEDIKYL